MSDRYVGGIIKGDGTEFTTSRFGTNSGMFTLGQQLQAFTSGNWPSDYDVVLTFSGVGSFEVPAGVDQIAEYVVIGGGGAGGTDNGGGGGAGGVRFGTGMPVIPGKKYPIEIGGGAGIPGTPSVAGANGLPSAFRTEANVRYYVSVGNPGAGNRYYVKTEPSDDAASNITPALNLYEGSTYVFDQTHPTNAPNHPLRFATDGAPSFTPYTTGVTTNQPSVGVGTAGSAVQLQVATPAPDLVYYCTVHGAMGNDAFTPANITIKCDGGGGGGSWGTPRGQPGGSGGGNGAQGAVTNHMGNSIAITQLTAAGETSIRQGFAGGSAGGTAPTGRIDYAGGGGGGAGGRGGNAASTPGQARGGNGGNGITISITGTSQIFAGGGGAGDGPGAASPGGGKGGNAKFFGQFRGGAGDGAHDTVKHGFAPAGGPGVANTGGGGGGGGVQDPGGGGGSGLVLIKFKNKPTNKSLTFNASTTFKNNTGAKTADYLIVGGGGGGGYRTGGGGGAGGFRAGSGLNIEVDNLKISVGAGGAGATSSSESGGNGGESFIQGSTYHIGSNGGGGGASSAPGAPGWNGREGASGGGASRSYIANSGGTGGAAIPLTVPRGHAASYPTQGSLSQTSPFPVQGFAGAAGNLAAGSGSAGGGGGSAQAGFAGTTDIGGNGGNGITSSITGQSLPYAGGGAGANNSSTAPGAEVDRSFGGDFGKSGGNSASVNAPSAPQVATKKAESGRVNSGGGGGGGFGQYPDTNAPFNIGGSGSSGIVVLKFTG